MARYKVSVPLLVFDVYTVEADSPEAAFRMVFSGSEGTDKPERENSGACVQHPENEEWYVETTEGEYDIVVFDCDPGEDS